MTEATATTTTGEEEEVGVGRQFHHQILKVENERVEAIRTGTKS